MTYILYNELANNGAGKASADEAAKLYAEKNPELKNVVGLDIRSFIGGLGRDDKVILCGGDGTLNRFVNDMEDSVAECGLYLYKSGTGNDFFNDIGAGESDKPVRINEYLANLPTVTVAGKTRRFINGIGYGIDGMACEVADRMKAEGKENINYASISIKLLLFHYKCPNAKVTVDGKTYEYKKVWLCSSMKGRYYGGGMKIAPDQDRNGDSLSAVVLHGSGKLKTLMIFPGIFKGEHVKHEDVVAVKRGKEIKVEFDRPMALQIDGETVSGVTEYSVKLPEYAVVE